MLPKKTRTPTRGGGYGQFAIREKLLTVISMAVLTVSTRVTVVVVPQDCPISAVYGIGSLVAMIVAFPPYEI